MKIALNRLADSLDSPGCAFGALSSMQMPRARLDRCIENMRRRQQMLDSRDHDHCRFADWVAGPLALVSSTARARLQACEIYLLPYPVCTAYSTRMGERRLIVVSSGLLDLIETTTCSAHVIGSLPEATRHLFPVSELVGMSLADIVNQMLFVLLFRLAFQDGYRPNIQALATAQMIHDARVSAAGATAFVLLHELAHLELHHHTTQTAPAIDIASSIPEPLSPAQRQEHEADQTAIAYLEPQWREFGHYWRNCAFDFFVRLELMSGAFTKTHPLALNRIFHLDEKMKSGSGFYDFSGRLHINAALAEAFTTTERQHHRDPAHMLNLGRETCLAILAGIRQPLLQAGGPDLEPLLKAEGPSWQANMMEKGAPWQI